MYAYVVDALQLSEIGCCTSTCMLRDVGYVRVYAGS